MCDCFIGGIGQWGRDNLVNSIQGFGRGVPASITSSGKNFVIRNTLVGFGSHVN